MFEFQTDRNHYVDLRQTYMALKVKFVKGRGYKTYNGEEVKKRAQKKAGQDVETEKEDQEAPVPLVTHVNKLSHLVVSNVELYINNQHIYNSKGSCAHKSYNSNNFKGTVPEHKGTKEFSTARVSFMKNFQTRL